MKLALFFTRGISLKIWDEIGNLDREIKPYKKLNEYFDEILFFTYGSKDDLEYQKKLASNIKILPQKHKMPSLLYSFLLPFFYYKELRRVDILKTNQVHGSWAAVMAKILFRKKLVVRQGRQWSIFAEKQGVKKWKMPLIHFLEKLAYKNADAIIVASQGEVEFIQEKYNISLEKIKYIPNYIDTDLFRPLDVSKENRICCVAKLENQKNLFNLIKAVSDLEIKLVIFGNGALKRDLEDFAKKLKPNVEFLGNISNQELPVELNKSILFALPSLYEGCPKAILEAMACGLPVIGTDVDGTKEIIRHKENGYLAETSVDSIRKAIKEILDDENLREKISQNARKTILENFSLEKMLDKEIAIYKKI